MINRLKVPEESVIVIDNKYNVVRLSTKHNIVFAVLCTHTYMNTSTGSVFAFFPNKDLLLNNHRISINKFLQKCQYDKDLYII